MSARATNELRYVQQMSDIYQHDCDYAVRHFTVLSILGVSGAHTMKLRKDDFYYEGVNTYVFSRVHATLYPALSIGRSVSQSVTLHFFMIFIFGPYCSCPNGLVTSNMAQAHPHATSVAVYPALLASHTRLYEPLCRYVRRSIRMYVFGSSFGVYCLFFYCPAPAQMLD